ncbi:hypothetical protein IWX49DRAFT_194358 [Phyllosticta citricarpa]
MGVPWCGGLDLVERVRRGKRAFASGSAMDHGAPARAGMKACAKLNASHQGSRRRGQSGESVKDTIIASQRRLDLDLTTKPGAGEGSVFAGLQLRSSTSDLPCVCRLRIATPLRRDLPCPLSPPSYTVNLRPSHPLAGRESCTSAIVKDLSMAVNCRPWYVARSQQPRSQPIFLLFSGAAPLPRLLSARCLVSSLPAPFRLFLESSKTAVRCRDAPSSSASF